METGLQLGSSSLHIRSQMMDLTLSNKDPSYKAVSIFETVISISSFKYILEIMIQELLKSLSHIIDSVFSRKSLTQKYKIL